MKVSRTTSVIILVSVAIVAVLAGLYTPKLLNWGNEENGYGYVSVEEAQMLIGEKSSLVILDVRTVAEFDDGHIEGAINIPVDEVADRLSELDANDELLVYCRTGNRSRNAVVILEDAGYTRIYHMHEGISAWIQRGYPVVQ